MCELCETCDGCFCPRCPKNPYRYLLDENASRASILTQHYSVNTKLFCQICVEQENNVKFTHHLPWMFCDKHKIAHYENGKKEKNFGD